jgi:hypothetical protein
MNPFVENESYKHKMAKDVLREWFYGGERIGDIGTESTSRTCGVWFEYPLVKNERYNSVLHNWDEIITNPNIPDGVDVYSDRELYDKYQYEYVPTYSDCIKLGLYPKRVVDVVIPCKGNPVYFIEICHTHPTPPEKVKDLKQMGVYNLIEIDAEWIMRQTKKPTQLEYKRLI